eukprot:scaffold63252_cov46-Prasinocladus_malaysianus.AAC.5
MNGRTGGWMSGQTDAIDWPMTSSVDHKLQRSRAVSPRFDVAFWYKHENEMCNVYLMLYGELPYQTVCSKTMDQLSGRLQTY